MHATDRSTRYPGRAPRLATGAVADSYVFTAYGEPVATSGAGDWNTFLYGGQVGYYSYAGGSLVQCGARWYDPYLARWLTRDPIGYGGGDNLYAYCGSNPTGLADCSGLYVDVTYNHRTHTLTAVDSANRTYTISLPAFSGGPVGRQYDGPANGPFPPDPPGNQINGRVPNGNHLIGAGVTVETQWGSAPVYGLYGPDGSKKGRHYCPRGMAKVKGPGGRLITRTGMELHPGRHS